MVNGPMRGYGIFIENMLDVAARILKRFKPAFEELAK